jgi:ubiquinone/menaquinone biosynthesis C-methylase UbiE
MADESQSARELYDRNVTTWARREPSSVSDFTARPAVLELCRPYDGQRVLDLGCGEGYCARILRRTGAGEVLGIDVSSGMVEAARREEEREPLGIQYQQGDASHLVLVPDADYDLVLAMFLFNYLTTDALATCMAEVRRVLRPGGRFVFAVPHPSLPWLRAHTAPFFFAVPSNDYFETRNQRFAGKIWKRDGTPLEVQLVHKTLEDFFRALQEAGFRGMPTLRELRVTPEILQIDPEFFGPLVGTPLHLAVVVER